MTEETPSTPASRRDVCPFCGAGRTLGAPLPAGMQWTCETIQFLRREPDGEWVLSSYARSTKCYEREIAALKAELTDIQQTHAEVMDESCDAGDERHCTCVPHLRREIARLKAELADVYRALSTLRYTCAVCGGISTVEDTLLDNGAALECLECGSDTVVRLFSREDYVAQGGKTSTPQGHRGTEEGGQ